MSDTTTHLGLPYLMAAQAQKHVTVNEALRILDGLVQLSVVEARADPPEAPVPGARYLVTAPASGLWTGWEDSLALFDDNAWRRLVPQEGWFLWDAGAVIQRRFDGAVWQDVAAVPNFASGEVEALGVATAADATNRLVVASPASLLTHAGAGHQLKINKAAAGDTASVLFQTGFSGRAEMGLAGENDFSFKVSPDGSQWREAIRINRSTGRARVSGVRELLTAARTYFVRKDGNDANSGLSDDAGGAFLTIGRAIDVAFGALDLGPFDVTIQVREGAYEEFVYIPSPSVGAGSVLLRGEAGDPSAVVLRMTASVTSVPAMLEGIIHVWNGAFLRVADLLVERTSGNSMPALDVRFGGHVLVASGSEFYLGSSSTAAIRLISGYFTSQSATLRHVGNAPRLIQNRAGNANLHQGTLDVDGRSYSAAMLHCDRAGAITGSALNFTGAATGDRVQVRSNGVIDFNVQLSSLPGSANGVIDTGGVYLPVP